MCPSKFWGHGKSRFSDQLERPGQMCRFRCYNSAIPLCSCRCWRGVLLQWMMDSQKTVSSKSTTSVHSQLMFFLESIVRHRQTGVTGKAHEYIIQRLFLCLFAFKEGIRWFGACWRNAQSFSPPLGQYLTDDTSCPSLKADGSLEFRSCKWSNTAKMYQRLALSCSRSICLNDRDRCP